MDSEIYLLGSSHTRILREADLIPTSSRSITVDDLSMRELHNRVKVIFGARPPEGKAIAVTMIATDDFIKYSKNTPLSGKKWTKYMHMHRREQYEYLKRLTRFFDRVLVLPPIPIPQFDSDSRVAKIVDKNRRTLAQYCSKVEKLEMVDIFDIFTNGNEILPRHYTPDGIYWNYRAMHLVADKIINVLIKKENIVTEKVGDAFIEKEHIAKEIIKEEDKENVNIVLMKKEDN